MKNKINKPIQHINKNINIKLNNMNKMKKE